MVGNRRTFMKSVLAGAAGGLVLSAPGAAAAQEHEPPTARTIPVALVQFDAVPEQVDLNLREIGRLTEQAVKSGARWVMFHEGTACDYTPRLRELAEKVPEGKCTQWVTKLASREKCFISFGLSETREDRFHISQVFVGPQGFLYRYRKTWIYHDPKDHEDVSLSETLVEAGYINALISSVYHQFKPGRNFHRGFHTRQWVRGLEYDS